MAKDAVEVIAQGRQVVGIGREGAERRLELGHVERGAQPFAGDVAEGEAERAVGLLQGIHEVAADVVGRARKEPGFPAVLRQVFGRHEGELHRPSGSQLVLRQQLILQLQQERQQQDDEAEDEGKRVEVVEEPLQEEQQRTDEQQAAWRRQLQKAALEHPEDEVPPAAERAHLVEPLPVLGIEVELVDVLEVPAHGALQVAPPQVFQDGLPQPGALGLLLPSVRPRFRLLRGSHAFFIEV